MDINEKYFGYGSTMSFIIFNRIENNLNILIDNKLSSTYLQSASLSKSLSNLDLVSLYYSKTNYLIIFDILKCCTKNICHLNNEIIYHDYNINNYLLILFENGELGLIKNNSLIVDILPNFQNVIIFRWYPYCSLDENIFCFCTGDNDIYMINLNSEKKYETKIGLNNIIKEYKTQNNKISELQWYLSDKNYKYILIGFDSSDICLCDMNPENATIITKFEKSGKNLNKLIWIKNEPGVFYAFYKSSAKISIFNASSVNPKKITKFTEKNISNCLLITFSNENKLLISLTDGEVIIFDLDHKKIEKELTQGHAGTIFDLKFNPFIKGLMASSSIDGMIKIWDIYNQEKNIINLTSTKLGLIKDEDLPQIISIKWSPNEENKKLILSGDSKSTIKIWDINKKKIVCQIQLGINNNKDNNIDNINNKINKYYNVVGLDWNEENIIIATCNTCIYIINFTGNKLILTDVINVHNKLCKIEFSPYPEEKKAQTFAVACADGKIRIYEISKLKLGNNISPIKILSGHTDLVFGLNYKPSDNNSKKYFLASGSDDYKVGIWSWTSSNNTSIPKRKFLYGHTDKVRNVVWFKHENILISGSWDGLAFIWDIENYICLSIINKHKSDIYGIDTNKINPYLFATSSRDCSICIFNYDINIVEHIIIYKNILNEINVDKYPYLLNNLKKIEKNDNISRAELISEYFLSLPCLKELYDILRIIYHKSEHNTDNNKIFHLSDLYSAYKSNILKSEFDFNENNIKENNIKNKLIDEAILKCAVINDWEKFCELNILINNWKKALMFAPKVSRKYWENLVIRYNQYLIEEKNNSNDNNNNDDIILYKLLETSITKDIKDSIELLEKQKEYDNCLLLFVKNIFNKSIKIKEQNYNNNDNNEFKFINDINEEEKINNLINQITNDKSGENYTELMKIINLYVKDKLSENKIIEAICIFLSVNQITLAIKLLISLAQYELAFYLMDISQDYLYEDIIYINLLKQSIKMNNYKNNVQLIRICQNKKIKAKLYKLLINHKIQLELKELNDFNELLNDFKKNNINDKNKEIDIFLNLNNDIEKFLPEIIDKYYNTLLTELYEEKIKIETLFELNELFNELRIYDINIDTKITKKINIKKKILLILIILETLNKNCASIKLLINEYLKISNINNINELEENEKMIINIGNYFYKSINNQSLLNINFNLNLSLKKNINFEKIREDINKGIKNSQNKNINIINRFSCDLYNKFFLHTSNIKNNILEVNKYIQIINEFNI